MDIRQERVSSKIKRNNLARTGIPSFDLILHGGIPLGTLAVIEESQNNESSTILAKAYLGEGAVSNDLIFYYSEEIERESIPDVRRIGNASLKGDTTIRYETYAENSGITEPYAIDLSSTKLDYKNLVLGSVDCMEENFYHKL